MKMTTRTSRRLSHLSPENVEIPKRFSKRQKAKPLISDDSDEEYSDKKQEKKPLRTPRKAKRFSDQELEHESPTKLLKTITVKPSTPIHNKRKIDNPQTPSALLDKLTITSPNYRSINKTSVKEIKSNGDTLDEINERLTKNPTSRKNLFNDNNSNEISKKPIKAPKEEKPKKIKIAKEKKCKSRVAEIEDEKDTKKITEKKNNSYQNAKRALHSSFPTNMPAREKEHDELRSFIQGNLENKTSASLYVSGPPGTGKTASLNLILQEDNISNKFKQIYVNCTAIKSASSIYSRIVKDLGVKVSGKTEKDYLASLDHYLKKNHKMILLVLDEIDQLESKNQSILYTIFEWPSKPNSQIILVGIANALDLTDRILPRLQARCELKPKLMHFAPYSKQQIVEIFTSRLKEAGVLDVFSPVALQMLAGKVASVSGDVRRALDIGRRVIELVDQSKKGDVLKPIENLANDLVDSEKSNIIVPEKSVKVDLKEVMNVLNNVYGTSQNLSEEQDDFFPLQQKIIVCSMLLILKKAKNKDITIGKLHEVYRRACTKRNILAVDQSEFAGLCSLIETRGIIKITGKKEPRLHKVNLEWDEEEVVNALKDKQLMSMILQDDSCLGRL